MSRLFQTPFGDVYPHYVAKTIRKGQSVEDLDDIITWLTGFSKAELDQHIANQTTFEEFFKQAKLNENAELITGTICGVKIQEIEDPLMKKIRYLDKVVDEIAAGRPLEKVKRKQS